VLLVLLLLLTGCATWTRVGGDYSSSSENYSVELPDGWMRAPSGDRLVITRDGILLQNIIVETKMVDAELTGTKKKLKKGMLPQEVAEVILDGVSSNQANLSFELLENQPTTISGLAGFKAVFGYKTKSGLRIKAVYYGLLAGDTYYGLYYAASRRYYFDKDIETFEKVVQSFKLLKTWCSLRSRAARQTPPFSLDTVIARDIPSGRTSVVCWAKIGGRGRT
jgi:hypothetical protein